MINFIKLYLFSIPIFCTFDLVWIGLVAKNFYKEQIGHLMAPDVRWGAAILFYCLYLLGLVFFAVWPAFKENNWLQALLYGAFFGLVCYATYDLTNLATLSKWPLKMVLYDLIWGAVVSGLVSLATFWIGRLSRG